MNDRAEFEIFEINWKLPSPWVNFGDCCTSLGVSLKPPKHLDNMAWYWIK